MFAISIAPEAALPAPFGSQHVIAVDAPRDAVGDFRGDLLSLSLRPSGAGWELRVAATGGPGVDPSALWADGGRLDIRAFDAAGRELLEFEPRPEARAKGARSDVWTMILPAEPALATGLAKADAAAPVRVIARSVSVDGIVLDEIEGWFPATRAFEAHCAFAHHGNQGLAYSDVFLGSASDPDGSGFDEALQIHEATGVPGNFHLSGTLQTSAEWDHNSGSPVDFNGWLASGVGSGWAAMLTSAYAQHIMPFTRDEMNDWAVNVETQMVNTRYGYFPRTAWVPERVWLDPSRYPSSGVADWIGDNFLPHGVWAVILDDDVHLSGYDNHQIHTLTNGLRIVPRDRSFTGNIVGGNGQAALDILSNLANSGVGEFRIAVYAEDWEAAAEMGIWSSVTPFAKETYDWFIDKVNSEPWITAWRIDDALNNPNFNGTTIAQLGTGTYNEIGGVDGYGGGNNGWYTHWAGFVPYVTGGDGFGNCAGGGGNCRNYGGMWDAAASKLLTVPSNNLSEAGWYVMMTNLHETGWHDNLGGDISGWQHKYSAHVKNAMVYAEAARWAGGLYVDPTGAFASDIDEDGYDELVLYNDRVFAVFESVGGRAVNVFAKGGGYEFSAVGVDNAYWYGTEADYNDGNHVGAYSDVGPNTQHEPYSWSIDSSSGSTVELSFTHGSGLTKSFSLTTGDAHIRGVYRTGSTTTYVQTGMSPGLVDLVWNAQMDRVWVGDQAYMGRRNPNTGATVAYVLGTAGASHVKEISGQIMRGDEISGSGAFEFYLFAAQTTAPVAGEIAELRALATGLVDAIGPRPESAEYLPGTDRLRVVFDQPADPATLVATGFSIDEDMDGSPELILDAATTVVELVPALTLSLQLTPLDAVALEALDPSHLELLVGPGSVDDVNANPGLAGTVPVSSGIATAVSLDGHLEATEWKRACDQGYLDQPFDSAWTAANELDAVYVRWDASYLYLAIDGLVTGNSWILYLDTDPGGPNGQTDLTAIDAWERGASFTHPDFKADFQYGCYQHQGQFDSDSFFSIDSPTTTTDLSGQISSAFDSQHVYAGDGGSELAIPWDVLYGLGPGIVPPNAVIGFVVSICWDPEPNGELGGDSLPSNTAATLPVLDYFSSFGVDGDGDGLPELEDDQGPLITDLIQSPVTGLPKRVGAVGLEISFDERVETSVAENPANYTVFETALPSNSLTILSVQLFEPERKVAFLEVDAPAYTAEFTVTVANAQDTSCNANVTPIQSASLIINPSTPTPEVLARRVIMLPNVPNPFNPSTLIRFRLPEGEGVNDVTVDVFDLRGRRVKNLLRALAMDGGEHSVRWGGDDERGQRVASGEYIVRLRANGEVLSQKVSLAK